jgi:hypothetical protein
MFAKVAQIRVYFSSTFADCPGTPEANGRESKSCLGQVFNFKVVCFVISVIVWHTQARPRLELKLSLSLSTAM